MHASLVGIAWLPRWLTEFEVQWSESVRQDHPTTVPKTIDKYNIHHQNGYIYPSPLEQNNLQKRKPNSFAPSRAGTTPAIPRLRHLPVFQAAKAAYLLVRTGNALQAPLLKLCERPTRRTIRASPDSLQVGAYNAAHRYPLNFPHTFLTA